MTQPYTMSRNDRSVIMDALDVLNRRFASRVQNKHNAEKWKGEMQHITALWTAIQNCTNQHGQVFITFTSDECVLLIRALQFHERVLTAKYRPELQDRITYIRWTIDAVKTYQKLFMEVGA